MIYVVVSQEDRLVFVEKTFTTLEKAKMYVDSIQFSRKTELDWENINKIWFKSYKTPASRVVFSIYTRKLE